MNQADSEKIHMILLQSGLMKAKDISTADLVVFNTCSVRQKGEDRVFGFMREVSDQAKYNNRPKPVIGITGCMVRKTGMNQSYLSTDTERKRAKKIELLETKDGIFNADDKLFPRSPLIDFVLRIEEVKYIPLILSHITGTSIGKEHSFDDYLKVKQHWESKASAPIIIQTGCDNYCSFCIVPYTRGKEISRPHDEIIREVEEVARSGIKEITLVGQNVNSYGKQFVEKKLWNTEKSSWNEWIGESPFRKLLNDIDGINGIERIRFTSSNPHDMTQDILDAHFDLQHTCPYLHFALQSGSNEMLKRMNRKHTYEDFKRQVDYLRSKDPLFSISTDIIVGFSGETEAMFQDTLRAFRECEFDFAFNARYSVRKGTLAEKMYPDDIPDSVKAERWHILNDTLLENITKRNQMMIGREEEVLISGKKDESFYGRTRNFKEVFFEAPEDLQEGDAVHVQITELDRYVLRGKFISKR